MKWLAVLVLGGCMSPVMTFGEGKTAKQAQHDTLAGLLPTPLATEGRWHGPVATAKIRIYADDAYRAQNLNWRHGFDDRLDYVNAVLGANFGVRLVPEYREWHHHSPSASLADDLEQLRELDAGNDVLSVVGLTSSQSLVSATFEQLGYASVPGRHMMLRGYADLEERKVFSQAFPALSEDERANALEARRQHKTAALLLHELGHNLGAPHDEPADTLMNAMYSEHAGAFSAEASAMIQRTLDQRLGRAPSEGAPVAMPVAAAAPMAAAPPANKHPKMVVVLLPDVVTIDGKSYDDRAIDAQFGAQAKLDGETELLLSKDKAVPTARVIDVIDRAKAQGLKNITFR